MDENRSVEAFLLRAMEGSAMAIEVLAVGVIVLAIAVGTVRYLVHMNREGGDPYQAFKVRLVKALLLGLEFLVAADIVRTVALQATLASVAVLAALVVVRTFLSWSLVVEIEGRWPWQAASAAAAGAVREG